MSKVVFVFHVHISQYSKYLAFTFIISFFHSFNFQQFLVSRKMRLFPILRAPPSSTNARRPQREPVPFQMLLPLQLKKTVSGKGDKQKEAACMQELAVMFACFKKNEFDQQECLKEVTAFQGCYKDYNERLSTQREQGKKGVLVPGEKKMTHRQMNQLLKRFPPK